MGENRIHALLAHGVGLFAVIAPALMGSVHPLTRTALIFGGLGVFLLAVAGARTRHRRISFPLLFVLYLIAFLIALLQCIPLPVSWLEYLSPHLADLRTRLGHDLSPLAYDPPAALLEAFETLALAGFLFAAYQVTRQGTYTQRMVQIVAFGGALLAAVAFFHHFAGVTRMYGLYAPQNISSFFVPFVNSNHAAGYYAFIFFVLLSLGIAEPGARLRAFTLAAAALPFLAVLWTGSRAGIAALGAGVLLWRIFSRFARDTAGSGTAIFLTLVGLLVAIPLMDFFVAPFLQSPSGLDEDVKIRMWENVWPLVRDHAWTGTGPGAFSSVYPYYHALPDRVHLDYAENIALQFASDYGLLAAGIFLAGGLFLVTRYLRHIRMRAWKAGLLAAASTLILQNLFDFNLEFPGTALPLAVILGVLAAQHYHGDEAPPKLVLQPAVFWSFGILSLAGALFAVPLYALPHELEKERAQAAALVQERRFSEAATAAADAQHRHPADATLAAIRGYAETFVPQGTPLRWIGLASWLYPRHPTPDLMAARVLASWKRPRQALLQYRLALEKGAPLTMRLVREIRPLLDAKTTITDVVPPHAWNALIPLLPENERLPVCRVQFQNGTTQSGCLRMLITDALARRDWIQLERLAILQEAATGAGVHTEALRLRALHEQGRHAEFEKRLEDAIRRHPRSGVMNAAAMMLACRARGADEALKWARARLDSRRLPPAQAFFLAACAARLLPPESPESILWRRRQETLASAGRSPADQEAFSLLDFLWDPAQCAPEANPSEEKAGEKK